MIREMRDQQVAQAVEVAREGHEDSHRHGRGLAALIDPLTPEQFLSRYWEQEILVQKGRSNRYQSLLSPSEVMGRLHELHGQLPELRLLLDGEDLDQMSFTFEDPTSPRRLTDERKVRRWQKQGATLALLRLHRYVPKLKDLRNELEILFGFSVGITAYISPGNPTERRHQGAPLHYDTHDVMVLQVGGSKLWRVFDAPYPLPLYDQDADETGMQPQAAPTEHVLEAGDFLYLPRGYFHEAIAGPEESVHLAIGVYVDRWIDALAALVKRARQSEQFRRGIPPRGLSDEKGADFASQFRERLHELSKDLDAQAVAADLKRLVVLESLILR
jgi:hypothetical protein